MRLGGVCLRRISEEQAERSRGAAIGFTWVLAERSNHAPEGRRGEADDERRNGATPVCGRGAKKNERFALTKRKRKRRVSFPQNHAERVVRGEVLAETLYKILILCDAACGIAQN